VKSDPGTRRVVALAGLVILVFLGLGLPAARTYDTRVDRTKPLYADLAELAQLELAEIRTHGEPVALSLDHGTSAAVGGERFRPSVGVVVEAKPDGTGFCLRGHDGHGDSVGWQCHSADEPTPSKAA
jgi:hypothetical protein